MLRFKRPWACDRFRVKDRLQSVDLPVRIATQANRSAEGCPWLSVCPAVVTQFVTHASRAGKRSCLPKFVDRVMSTGRVQDEGPFVNTG
jgi:hypothetical protein